MTTVLLVAITFLLLAIAFDAAIAPLLKEHGAQQRHAALRASLWGMVVVLVVAVVFV